MISSISEVTNQLRAIAFRHFYNFKSYKIFSSVFGKNDINELKRLASDKSVIVCKPDKGNGVVLVDRCRYVQSMQSLISDTTKFVEIKEPIEKYTRKIEDKTNNFLRKLKNNDVLSDDLYKQLYVTGSAPGILYGLPKIHKPNFSTAYQFRPIFAAYDTPSFGIAKYLVSILNPLTTNSFTVKNTYDFVDTIVNFPDADKYFMCSFDVENLFTNIPLHDTIEICINSLFAAPYSTVLGLSRTFFRTLLELSVLNSFFCFNGKFYKQIEGLGMGLPLGPTFANIFMCFNEKIWLDDCPEDFKPVLYRRYIDDTFILFRHSTHAHKFLDYLNQKHANINFTLETEHENSLAFLDCRVTRSGSKFETSVYRKDTFSGQGLSFFSFCSFNFKLNSVRSLLSRGYNVCSSFINIHSEFEFLKTFFHQNGFPIGLITTNIKKFLAKRYSSNNFITVPKENFYFTMPFYGPQSDKLRKDLYDVLSKSFTHVNFNIVLVNNFRIGNFFRYKDSLPPAMQASLVYKYRCAHCASEYIGSTTRTLHTRVAEHAGKSFRTGALLTSPPQSSIREHSSTCNSPVVLEDFKIVSKVSNFIDLRILESLYIFKMKPVLNDTQSAFPLQILNK